MPTQFDHGYTLKSARKRRSHLTLSIIDIPWIGTIWHLLTTGWMAHLLHVIPKGKHNSDLLIREFNVSWINPLAVIYVVSLYVSRPGW